jgi:hypothetical protein
MQDPHQALKFEHIGKARAPRAGVDFVLVRGQSSKDDIGLGLHAAPNQYTTSGIQTPDFMSQLGFERAGCQFVDRRECFSRTVHKDFDLASFAGRFDEGFEEFKHAERNLETCVFFFDQMERWGYIFSEDIRVVEANARSTNWAMGIRSQSPKISKQQKMEPFGIDSYGW